MNISLINSDAVSGILKMEIEKADYADQVEKSLRGFRQKANVPGFRKGMVPMGMVKKMYGKHVLAEEVNKVMSENLYKYIRENELNILGEPLSNETEQKEIDFDTDENFEFYFDLAFTPELNITLNKKDKVPYYQITVAEDLIEKQVESYRTNYGSYDTVDDIEEKDMVKGTLAELENGEVKEGGIVVEDAVLMPLYMKNDEEKNKFIGVKNNTVVIFNPNKAYNGSEAELASLLKVDKAEVANITSDFSFEIKEITRHIPAEMVPEFFNQVFEPGTVQTEEEFRNKIKEQLAEQFVTQSDYKLLTDIRPLFLKKAGDVTLADDLLKRWLLLSDDKKTQEQVDEEYPRIVEDLKFHLVKENIVKKNDIKVENEDLEEFARKIARAQFAQYGMMSVPEDVIENYAQDMLAKKESIQNIIERVVEEKLTQWVKGQVKLDVKEVTIEEFNKLFE